MKAFDIKEQIDVEVAVSTADLIAELEKRKPNCDKCFNYPKTPWFDEFFCRKCIWPGWLGKDNFKPKEDR